MGPKSETVPQGPFRPALSLLVTLALLALLALGALEVCALLMPQLFGRDVHSPTSRVRSDLRSIAIALDTYRVDHGEYPFRLPQLTTPTPYLNALFRDSLSPDRSDLLQYQRLKSGYRLWSVGPDERNDFALISFDPTNGARSEGDMVRLDPESNTRELGQQ